MWVKSLLQIFHEAGVQRRRISARQTRQAACWHPPCPAAAQHTAEATHSAFCEHGAKAFQSAHFADLLHRAFHFLMHFQEPVDLLHCRAGTFGDADLAFGRSEEHTSELQSLMRISYAVFCL